QIPAKNSAAQEHQSPRACRDPATSARKLTALASKPGGFRHNRSPASIVGGAGRATVDADG
ncbi:hypothetical protein ACFXG4_50715, partial [Nocardia sp. NPDC059246]|uniref:hypothetical protein n=1 Tax=Nocardia sp. NPDC059246 TaxID=3346789 RepID=UPI00368640D2